MASYIHAERLKSKIIIAFAFLLIAATFGLLMRISIIESIGINYKHFLHTHSHVALLGWLYNLVLIFIAYYFFKKDVRKFNRIFWISQITFLGMLFSFPFQGYAFWSISFSTLYLFASYWLIFQIFNSSKKFKNKIEFKLLKAGSIFLFLSSIGPFALGAIMAKAMQESIWYSLSIYWFLHFLFNGFFYAVFLALLLSEIKKKVKISLRKENQVYALTVFSVIPLYAEFAIEALTFNWVILLALLSSLAQLASILLIIGELKSYLAKVFNAINKLLLGLAFLALLLKVVFQLITSFPVFHEIVFNSKSTLIIGYLHMVMLGMFSFFFIWLLIEKKLIQLNQFLKTGAAFFVVGVLLSELLLFGQGASNYFWNFSLPHYYKLLYSVSGLMPLGVLMMLISQFYKKTEPSPTTR